MVLDGEVYGQGAFGRAAFGVAYDDDHNVFPFWVMSHDCDVTLCDWV